jgi:hypothetical protein
MDESFDSEALDSAIRTSSRTLRGLTSCAIGRVVGGAVSSSQSTSSGGSIDTILADNRRLAIKIPAFKSTTLESTANESTFTRVYYT